jgi:hypothetical protein
VAGYAEEAGGQYMFLDVGHYLHEAADTIANEIWLFLQTLTE